MCNYFLKKIYIIFLNKMGGETLNMNTYGYTYFGTEVVPIYGWRE